MMANKWVLAGLTLGAAVGLFIGGFLSIANEFAPIVASGIVGLFSMWIGANARGTDGW